MTDERRAPTAAERRLVEALPEHLRSLGLDDSEVRDCVARVETGLLARRRPPGPDGDAEADRIHPVVVARAVAAAVRPGLDPDRRHVSVRVADATPIELLRELLSRLCRPGRRPGRRGAGRDEKRSG